MLDKLILFIFIVSMLSAFISFCLVLAESGELNRAGEPAERNVAFQLALSILCTILSAIYLWG